MDPSWSIVLGPKSRLPESGDLDLIHPVPREKIAAAIEASGAVLEPFDWPAEGARRVPVAEGALPLDLARAAEALAGAIGPVTIIDADFTIRVEVEAGTPLDQIVADVAEATRKREEKSEPAWNARPRVSLEPSPFAPGRPEKRILPPLKTTLIAAVVLFWVWLMVKDEFSGCIKRDSTARVPVNPELADTETAFTVAELMMNAGKYREITSEGWIELDDSLSLTRPVTGKGKAGKSYLCDGWKNPIRCTRTREGLRLSSCGPNGLDEQGQGDDVVRVVRWSTHR